MRLRWSALCIFTYRCVRLDWPRYCLYKQIELTPAWQDFVYEFTCKADEKNARINFILGQNNVSVEFSDVQLRDIQRDEAIEPKLSEKYMVSYRFNALGCRGRDYPIPKPENTVRILALGDSYTQGMGVHEEDTFVYQLEHLLNERAKAQGSEKIYEVINAGITGYSTREERLFYELFGAKYEPDVVLLVMVWNDDMSWSDESKRIQRTPGRLEQQFHIWGQIQQQRHKRPDPTDYSGSLAEVKKLHSELGKRGARLGIVFFRNSKGPPKNGKPAKHYEVWVNLVNTVTDGLQGYDIPTIDIGDALFENHTSRDLVVHERIDLHPNEIAHKIAARELRDFLLRNGLVPPGDLHGSQ